MGGTADQPGPSATLRRTPDRRALAIAGLAALTLSATVGARAINGLQGPDTDPDTAIVVGSPGGFVVNEPTPAPPSPEITSSPRATPSAPPVPTALPAAPTPAQATPSLSTPAPATAPPATPAPATPHPVVTPAPTPAPTEVVVAVAGPDETVAAFYDDVAAGDFDAAYALWSDRMKATYPRTQNLDERFAHTTEIRFETLDVAERSPTTAVVQANFTEFYDTGASRAFVGNWELILVDGRWLLDAPHY